MGKGTSRCLYIYVCGLPLLWLLSLLPLLGLRIRGDCAQLLCLICFVIFPTRERRKESNYVDQRMTRIARTAHTLTTFYDKKARCVDSSQVAVEEEGRKKTDDTLVASRTRSAHRYKRPAVDRLAALESFCCLWANENTNRKEKKPRHHIGRQQNMSAGRMPT